MGIKIKSWYSQI